MKNVGIPSHIYYWASDARRICVSSKKNTEKKNIRQFKRVQRKDQENSYTFGEGSVYNAKAGFDHFLVSLTKFKFSSLLTFIYKMT